MDAHRDGRDDNKVFARDWDIVHIFVRQARDIAIGFSFWIITLDRTESRDSIKAIKAPARDDSASRHVPSWYTQSAFETRDASK